MEQGISNLVLIQLHVVKVLRVYARNATSEILNFIHCVFQKRIVALQAYLLVFPSSRSITDFNGLVGEIWVDD